MAISESSISGNNTTERENTPSERENTPSERENFLKFTDSDNVKDIINDVNGLKQEVLSNNKEWNAARGLLDRAIEETFDKYAKEYSVSIQALIATNGYDILQRTLNDLMAKDPDIQDSLDSLKALGTINTTIELNQLSLDVLKSSILQNNTSNTGNNTNNTGNNTNNTGNNTNNTGNNTNNTGNNPNQGPLWNNNNGGSNNNGTTTTTNTSTNASSYGENTNVNYHEEKNPDGTMKIGTTSFGDKSTDVGHNEKELTHNGVGDMLYTGFTYAEGFVSKQQDKRNTKNGDEFDPTSDQKYKYKDKDIEYRDKNKQVHEAILKIMENFTKIDKNGDEGVLAIKDVRGLDWTKISDILYLITRDDKMKEHNLSYNDDEQTGNDLSAWKMFVNDSNDGIAISEDKEKEFKRLLKGIDYKGNNIKKLITFLNLFNNGETIPYINKLIDIGSRKGKSGRMQLIETSNASKLIDNVSASKGNKSLFEKDAWKTKANETRGGDGAEKMANNKSISEIEKTGNFFSFIADVNNDGRVDQYDLTGSITGFAFHGMLRSVCDVKRSGSDFEIVNGPRTSVALRNMLEKAYSTSHNVNLRSDIKSILDNHDFLHTHHAFELIKKYPEIKPFMIYDIQAETEYAQSTRKVQNTYEAFNPEIADSLLQTDDSDPIESYFTGEAIKDAMGDLHKTNIEQLKAIAAKEGITLNRNVDVDVIKAINVALSTLFMNFGPLMRAMKHDRLGAGQNDPGYTGQYNPGNSHLAIEGKIPLSKEDLQRPRNGQETKEFINSTGFKKWLKTTSITPLLGISTYADSEGNTKPSPVLGIGVSFDKTKMDPNQKWARHFAQVGVAYDVMDGQLFAGLNGENVRQINNKNLKDNLDTNKPYVKGLGMQYSVGGSVDVKNIAQSGLFASVGPLYQVDHLAGLDQVSKNFENFLSPFTKPIDEKFLQAKISSASDWNKLYIDLENHYLDTFPAKYKESKYLHLTESMIHLFVGRIQQQKLLENLANHDLPVDDKQKIIQAYMGQRIDGFVSTLYQAELARLNTKGLKLSKLGVKVGANLTVESLLAGGPIGVLFGMNLTFSAHNEIYGDDPHDINSVSKQLDYGAGMSSLNIPAGTSIENIAMRLENAFCIPGLSISANTTDKTLSFKNKNGGSVLDILHLYYTEDALKNAGFSFNGNVLTVGNVGTIGIANIFKGMTKSHYLILGSDKMIGCLEYNKYKETKSENKGEKPTITRQPLQPKNENGDIVQKVVGVEEKKIKVLPTLDVVKTQIEGLGTQESADILPYLKNVNAQGELILTVPNGQKIILDGIKTKTNGEYYIPATGTLSYIKRKTGSNTLRYESTPADKLIIKHKELLVETEVQKPIFTTEKINITFDASESFNSTSSIIESHRSSLKKFDNTYKDLVLKFLAAAKNLDRNGIDQSDYISALSLIKPKLIAHVNKQDFTDLINGAKDDELVYMVDRLKAVFAENYTFNSAVDVHKAMIMRKNTYKTILGPSGAAIPNDIAGIREGFKKNQGSTDIVKKTNLLGYTARYRSGGQEKEARGYSSTAYGHTNILNGFIQEIPDKKETQNWMIENLKRDQRNLDIVTKTINKSLTGKGITITTDNLLEILIKGKTSIDKTNKILILNVKWYFYLLGECANESVGLTLDGEAEITTSSGKVDDETQYKTKETSIVPSEKTGSVLNASKTTKTIDLDVKGKKGDINFVGQGSVQVGSWKESGGQGNNEQSGGQGTTENTDGGGQGVGEGTGP